MNNSINQFIQQLPKVELHLHLEGSFEPELMFEIAKRNKQVIPYQSIKEVKEAYTFNNLQEFLDIYYAGANVLLNEQDFFDLTWAYLLRIKEQNVVHVEVFFDPQTHTDRGVPFSAVITGIRKALLKGEEELGVSHRLIMSFLRNLSEESAFLTLAEAEPFKDWISGVGLDSSELGNPPRKFERVFKKSIEMGFLPVAHAGEEGPAEYIWEALNLLNVERIDHGNQCLTDQKLVDHLVKNQVPLTLCPLSNLELKLVKNMSDHPLLEMMNQGLMVNINSDDPAYFGGYMNENYEAVAHSLKLNKEQLAQLALNGINSSWMDQDQKEGYIRDVQSVLASHS